MAITIGIGCQDKADVDVIARILHERVRLVADLRSRPYVSGKRSLLNRNVAGYVLSRFGIGYIWLGSVLGNCRAANTGKALECFKAYMRTQRYEQAFEWFLEIVDGINGTVALLCWENEDRQCHRYLIMDAIKQREHQAWQRGRMSPSRGRCSYPKAQQLPPERYPDSRAESATNRKAGQDALVDKQLQIVLARLSNGYCLGGSPALDYALGLRQAPPFDQEDARSVQGMIYSRQTFGATS